MKTTIGMMIVAVFLLGGICCPAQTEEQKAELTYSVTFRDSIVATQRVILSESGDLKTISTSFSVVLPVFVARHHYQEEQSVTFRPDGTVVRLFARRITGPQQVEVTGDLQADGRLLINRTDSTGSHRLELDRQDYDYHSLLFYGTHPRDFLPPDQPARVRVLAIAEGRVEPFEIQVISESETCERQHLASLHLIWTSGPFVSHSWHPERFSNLPRTFIRQTADGEFLFRLLR